MTTFSSETNTQTARLACLSFLCKQVSSMLGGGLDLRHCGLLLPGEHKVDVTVTVTQTTFCIHPFQIKRGNLISTCNGYTFYRFHWTLLYHMHAHTYIHKNKICKWLTNPIIYSVYFIRTSLTYLHREVCLPSSNNVHQCSETVERSSAVAANSFGGFSWSRQNQPCCSSGQNGL